MNSSKALLHELIESFYQFSENSKEDDFNLAKFSSWLNDKICSKPRSFFEEISEQDNIAKQTVDTQISILMGRMIKYVRSYTKKMLHDSNLSGLDDYSFLATLMFHSSMSKAALTHHNLTENTSGADIIKRLIKKGFIEEIECVSDKREKRIRITESGKIKMNGIFDQMEPVSALIPGELNADDKLFLLHYLKKLDKFHLEIYQKYKGSEPEEYLDKLKK
jgi:MarR family transcriptional regulator, lower aerobic nicotinate degradation pathway regulator